MTFLRNSNVRRNRSLQIESLEHREMLSVNPLGIDNNAPAIYAAPAPIAAAIAPANARDQAVANDLIAHGASAEDIGWDVINGENRIVFIGGWHLSGAIDVSNCTALQEFVADGAGITSLNVSGCTNLTGLNVYHNQLTSLNVAGCTALTNLGCAENQLTSLDVSALTNLQGLDCGGNQLTTVYVPVGFKTAGSYQKDDNTELVEQAAPPAVIPMKPTNFKATTITQDSVMLSWVAVDGEPDYVVQYRAGTSGAWDNANVTFQGTSAMVTGLTAGTTYYFQVKAVNAGVESPVAATNATTTLPDATTQQPPNNVKVDVTDGKETKSATVTWTAPEGADSKTVYVIQYRIADSNGKWKKITVKAKKGAVLTDTISKDLKLKAGVNYEFQIFVKGVKKGPADSNVIEAGTVRAWGVIPTASLTTFKSGVTQNRVALQVKNYLSGDKPAIGKGSKSGVVDTLTVSYKNSKDKYGTPTVVEFTFNNGVWTSGNDDVTFEDGIIIIRGLNVKTKYTVTALFSNLLTVGSEAVSAKATSKAVSTAK
ncbi:hypothetical protein FACS1894170_09720 [Planctomycetales bacterium]|nr:hypothetical protein FACS1894170_09720 [Planctomycetales bacterium]